MAPTTHETEAKEENSEAVNDVATSLKLSEMDVGVELSVVFVT